jgi:hypothetical protein
VRTDAVGVETGGGPRGTQSLAEAVEDLDASTAVMAAMDRAMPTKRRRPDI